MLREREREKGDAIEIALLTACVDLKAPRVDADPRGRATPLLLFASFYCLLF
jgi:hypothetical protein